MHVSSHSVSPNLWIDSIEVEAIYLYEELGIIEAVWYFNLNDLVHFIADIDCKGNNYFDKLDCKIKEKTIRTTMLHL